MRARPAGVLRAPNMVSRHVRGYAGSPGAGVAAPDPRGQFAALGYPPHAPQGAVLGELLASLTGDPGVRLAATTGRRLFTGSTPPGGGPQKFLRPAGANQAEGLALAPVAAGNSRRALNRARGRPGSSR